MNDAKQASSLPSGLPLLVTEYQITFVIFHPFKVNGKYF